MSGVLDGKVAIITGGGSGIGQASAVAMAEQGAAVVVVDISETGLAETGALIKQAGGRCLTHRCDITKRAEVDEVVAVTVKAFGTVDILFNCAMIIRIKPLELQTEADLMDTLKVNLFGTFNFMQACFPYMKQHGGKIINCASGSGTAGAVTHSTYAAAKEAVRGLTKSAANEWGQYGINVNAIMPMAVTPSFNFAVNEMGSDRDEICRQMALHVPLRRLGDPKKDIAPMVVFLAGPGSNFVTGRSLFVDGGQSGFM